jgi:hypothetical protein
MPYVSRFTKPISAGSLALSMLLAGGMAGLQPAFAGDLAQNAATKGVTVQEETGQERSARGADAQARGIEKSDIRRGAVRKNAKSDGYKTDAGNALNAGGTEGSAPRRAGDPIPGTTAEDDW